MIKRSLIYVCGLIFAFQLIEFSAFAGDYKLINPAEL
jgi:hypothetical protein